MFRSSEPSGSNRSMPTPIFPVLPTSPSKFCLPPTLFLPCAVKSASTSLLAHSACGWCTRKRERWKSGVKQPSRRSCFRKLTFGSARSSTRLFHPYRRSLRLSQLLQHLYIPAVVAFFIDRRFQNEFLIAQLGMRQDAMKTFRSDVSFSDARMPVPMGTERHLGIVRVDHFHVFEAQDSVC